MNLMSFDGDLSDFSEFLMGVNGGKLWRENQLGVVVEVC